MEKLTYLDTNAFQLIAEDKKYICLFKNWLRTKNSKLVISSSIISELVGKYKKFNEFNSLVNDKEINLFFLGSYSLLNKLEKKYYPTSFNLDEISLNEKINKTFEGKPFDFNEIASNINFKYALNSQTNAAEISFPNIIIKWFAMNPLKNGYYSEKEKQKLKQTISTNIQKKLLTELNMNKIDLNYFKTYMTIIEFMFRKHLIQPIKNLKNSDFVDIQHIAYSPYMDFFITEKENADILSQIKNNSSLLQKTIVLKLGDFKKKLY
ncbi:MAG: hypothetical protein KKE93_01605 [Nanoarchaeota archaeon]|nr:hypothetical protein [Nanoarchaeota archaeon]